jgi:glucose/arabinose dehydrogenase
MRKFILLIVVFILVYSQSFAQSYTIETPITGLAYPIAFQFLPNGNVIMTHKPGEVKIYTLSNAVVSTFWLFNDSCLNNFERGTLGICLDPNYSSNHYVYVCYIHAVPSTTSTPQFIRIVRLTESGNVGTNPFIVLNYGIGTPAGNHMGGNMRFGPDGKLYVSIGENAVSSNSQLLTNPKGKILRLNSNGTIPTDNPFYDDGNPLTGNDDRIWCYGLRNSFDLMFSPVNDSLYASENGASTWDEVNFIRKGKNYGWPVCEGYCSPYNPAYRQPMNVWGSPLPSLTGIMVYSGSVMPELNNKLLVGSNNTNGNAQLYKCDLGNAPFYDTIVSRSVLANLNNLTGMAQGSDGYVYVLKGGYTTAGVLYRIKPSINGVGNQNTPVNFNLGQNYPNPFNPVTKIRFSLPSPSEGGAQNFRLSIYDVMGREVAVLSPPLWGGQEGLSSGTYEVEWDASNYPSGVYFYRLTNGDRTAERKMVVVK